MEIRGVLRKLRRKRSCSISAETDRRFSSPVISVQSQTNKRCLHNISVTASNVAEKPQTSPLEDGLEMSSQLPDNLAVTLFGDVSEIATGGW